MEEEATIAVEAKRKELEEESWTPRGASHRVGARSPGGGDEARRAAAASTRSSRRSATSIVDLGEEGACPVCTRPLDQHYRGVLEHFDEQLETIAVDGQFYNTRLDQLEEMPDEVKQLDEARRALQRRSRHARAAAGEGAGGRAGADAALEGHRRPRSSGTIAVRRDLGAIPAGYDGAQHAALRSRGRAARAAQRAGDAAQCTDRSRAAARAGTQSRRRTALGALRDRARRAARASSERRVLGGGLRGASLGVRERRRGRARGCEVAAASAQGDANAARAALESAERSRRELRADAGAARRHCRSIADLHDELDRAYSDLRTDLNFQLRPELSELASAFLHDLTDARYSELELDDNYNVLVLEDGIPKPVISGGEEDLANLVLRLAISQMIAERAGQQFSLLVLDEVFGSLDESRRHNVVELLRRSAGSVRAGHSDHAHRVGARGSGPGHHRAVRRGDRSVGRDAERSAVLELPGAGDDELERRRVRRVRGDGLMATARDWKTARHADGPHPVRLADIPALNQVFSDAFTERYRRDGMVGVRVPFLNPAIWRYAIEDAGIAARWCGAASATRSSRSTSRTTRGSRVDGPLAVRPEWQGGGWARRSFAPAIGWLTRARRRSVIGLETMPRTMDNIGFYSGLGFLPTRLTVTLTLDAAGGDCAGHSCSAGSRARDKDDALAECLTLTQSDGAGVRLLARDRADGFAALGDTLLRARGRAAGSVCAVSHGAAGGGAHA